MNTEKPKQENSRKVRESKVHRGGAKSPPENVRRVEDTPPNGNLKKQPDEAYGDTEILERHRA